MIGVVVPANDEEALIGRCLGALKIAARHPALAGEAVEIVVVLDACRDATQRVALAQGAACIAVEARNVGIARATGASALIAQGARWLAFTDADSVVAPDWLARQVETVADAVCGVVCIDDWGDYSAETRASYEAGYVDADHHRHIHGASMGVSSAAYQRVGGFAPLRCSEDVELVRRLDVHGATIRWTNSVRVRTSARRVARAPDGFSEHLRRAEHDASTSTAPLDSACSVASAEPIPPGRPSLRQSASGCGPGLPTSWRGGRSPRSVPTPDHEPGPIP